MFKPTKSAFTLVELLVVIAIIGLLASLSVISLSTARAKARDVKRIADAKQISTALEMFFNDAGHYPDANDWNSGSLSYNGQTYLSVIPTTPNPPDGNCNSSNNSFSYTQTESGASYTLSFCTGGNTGSLSSGIINVTPAGLANASESNSGWACGDVLVDYRDSQSYNTVLIGSQCWMAQNLNIGTYIGNGSSTPGFDGTIGTDDDCTELPQYVNIWSCQGYTGIQKYCYDNNTSNCTTYGGMYEWAETVKLPSDCNYATVTDNGNDSYTVHCPSSGDQIITATQQGICPNGWHIPNDSEWHTLEYSLSDDPTNNCDVEHVTGNCEDAGSKLKSASWNGNNSSGFSALPAGIRVMNSGMFLELGDYTHFWSSAPLDINVAHDYSVRTLDSGITRYQGTRSAGLSVRCIQN